MTPAGLIGDDFLEGDFEGDLERLPDADTSCVESLLAGVLSVLASLDDNGCLGLVGEGVRDNIGSLVLILVLVLVPVLVPKVRRKE